MVHASLCELARQRGARRAWDVRHVSCCCSWGSTFFLPPALGFFPLPNAGMPRTVRAVHTDDALTPISLAISASRFLPNATLSQSMPLGPDFRFLRSDEAPSSEEIVRSRTLIDVAICVRSFLSASRVRLIGSPIVFSAAIFFLPL